MRLRSDFLLFLILLYRVRAVLGPFFSELFGGGCDCPQSCSAQSPSQPCQMICPQSSCHGSPQFPERFYPPPSPLYLSASTYPIQQPQISFPRQFYPKPPPQQPQYFPSPISYSLQRPPVQFNPSIASTYGISQPIPQPAQRAQYAQMNSLRSSLPSSLPLPPPLPIPSPSPPYSPPQFIQRPATTFPSEAQYEHENAAAFESATEATPTNQPQTNGPDNESYDEEIENRNNEDSKLSDFSASQTEQSYESVEKSAVDEPNPQTGYRDDTQKQQVRLPRTDTLMDTLKSEEKFELAMRKGALDYEDGGLSEAIKPVKTKHSSLQRSAQFNDEMKRNDIFADGLAIPKEETNDESSESFKLRAEGGGDQKKDRMTNEEIEIYDDLLGSSFGTTFEKDGESLSATTTTSTQFSSPSFKEYALSSLRKPQKTKREHPSKCTSNKLRSLMNQSMSSSPSTSKQMVYSAVRAAFDERSPDVICSRSSFSYIVVTSPIYCEHRKAPVTCFVYFQP